MVFSTLDPKINTSTKRYLVGGLINKAPTDIVEMYNISTGAWTEVSLLPSPVTNMALATVLTQDLETEVIEDLLRFKGDVVIERKRRVLQPLADHFKWDNNENIHL